MGSASDLYATTEMDVFYKCERKSDAWVGEPEESILQDGWMDHNINEGSINWMVVYDSRCEAEELEQIAQQR